MKSIFVIAYLLLVSKIDGDNIFEIFPYKEHHFFLQAFESDIEFRKNKHNKIDTLVLHQGDKAMIAKKIVSNDAIIDDTAQFEMINEQKFVLINGIEQWITIKGNSTKSVILFLHGGPGSPISPYSEVLFKSWEKDFLIVQWDQRGTGKTYGKNAPEELTPDFLKANPLTVAQMTDDGIELSQYLIKRLNKKKIILFGTSWGSVLGVKMATKQPSLFYAYIGHSQITDPSSDSMLYHKVYQMSQRINDTASLRILNTIGKPPYVSARNVGQLLRVVKKYERANSIPAPETWFAEAPGYDTEKDAQDRSDGDDYSFVNYVGDTRLEVTSMRSTINLMKDNLELLVPVYFIQGEEDLLTPKEMTKKYFDRINAPIKEYFLLPKTAHGFNSFVLDTLHKICNAIRTNKGL